MVKSPAKLLIVLAFCVCSIIAYGQRPSQLSNYLSQDAIIAISNSTTVSVVKMAPTRKRPYIVSSKAKALSPTQIKTLKTLLLNNKNYLFGLKKYCLFVPKVAYTFKGKQTLKIIVSKNCQELLINDAGKRVFLNYDPMATKFNELIAQATKDLVDEN